MSIEALIIWLVIGAIAGWAAGQIMKGYGFGSSATSWSASSER